MRSLVIKAKNKYENKRAKREDGGGKGVRILGRLEVIETQKRNNCHAVNWYFLKHQRNSSLSSSTNLLSSRASASPLPHYLSTSWLAHRQLTFPISLFTAYGLVTCLPPPSLPPSLSIRHPTPFFTLSSMQQLLLHPRPSVTRSVRACISSTWLLLERELVRPIALHPTWQTDSFRLSISYQFNRHHLLVVVRSSPFIFLLFWGGGDNNNWAPPFPFDGYSRL